MRGCLSIPVRGAGGPRSTGSACVWLPVLPMVLLANDSGTWCPSCAAGAIPICSHGLVVQQSPSACSCKRSLIPCVPLALRDRDSSCTAPVGRHCHGGDGIEPTCSELSQPAALVGSQLQGRCCGTHQQHVALATRDPWVLPSLCVLGHQGSCPWSHRTVSDSRQQTWLPAPISWARGDRMKGSPPISTICFISSYKEQACSGRVIRS